MTKKLLKLTALIALLLAVVPAIAQKVPCRS